MKLETIIITKDAWKFLRNKSRTMKGYSILSEEALNKCLSQVKLLNDGANPETHPINDNEIRIDKECFSIELDKIKNLLNENGFGYRQDGFELNCICV